MLSARDPVLDERRLHEIKSALAVADRPRAIALACRALEDGLQDAMLLYLRSRALIQQSKYDAAVRDLVQAAALAPADLQLRTTCGSDLVELEHTREAIAILEESVGLAPDFAPAHFELGLAYEREDDHDRAKACYERTLALDPNHAGALGLLSALALQKGETSLASGYADQALAIDAEEYNALCTRAGVALAAGDTDEALALVRRLLGRKSLTPHEHAEALGLLGDVRHAERRFAEAFNAYTAGNARKRALYRVQFGGPGRESYSSYIAWLANHFETVTDQRSFSCRADLTQCDSDGRGLAFVGGFPRSGTTLLENILAVHPQLSTLGEKRTMADLRTAFLSNGEGLARLAALAPAETETARQAYWQRVRALGGTPDGKMFVDVNALNTSWLALVAKLFPHAKIIFAVRDPRDVVLSCFRRRFQMNLAMYEFVSLQSTARLYAESMRLAEIFRQRLGLDWVEVRHEALVADFEGEVSRICDFLGLSYVDRMRDFAAHARDRIVTTASASQIVRGLNSDGVGQWRNYAEQLAPVMSVLAPWVEKFGYQAD
jgi:tetratricopeptide (TPR) repeat protein